MKRRTRVAQFALAILSSAVASSAGAQVTVGTATSGIGNCYPIGCATVAVTPPFRYQQAYASTAFSSSMDISSFTFFHTVLYPGTGELGAGTYNFYFGTTSTAPNALSQTFADNISSPLSLFTTLVIPAGTSGAATTYTVAGTTAYFYNPSAGNLLMDVQYTNSGTGTNVTYFDLDQSGSGVVGRIVGDNTSGVLVDGSNAWGLVTRFDGTMSTTTTPEPGSLALMGTGLVGLAGVVRRRR